MSLAPEVRRQVRERARYACEYCGISEIDAGGELTIDHHRPRREEGDDNPANLIYCCPRCNLYKAAYWPSSADKPVLWNPRVEPGEVHFIEDVDGRLLPLTGVGAFTVNRLRLNRQPLIAYRLRRRAQAEDARLLDQLQITVMLLSQMQQRHASLLEEQRALLEQQRMLLALLLRGET